MTDPSSYDGQEPTPPEAAPPAPEPAVPDPSVAEPSVADPGAADPGAAEWQRLDPRMLLIGPLHALKDFAIPLIIALVGITSSAGSLSWYFAGPMLLAPIIFGFLPWITTRYRVTATQFQLRKGLIGRKQVTAPLDRVRSVDLEASLLHRLLSLTKVQIGTGVDDTRIELNALGVPAAEDLRRFLLARSRPAVWAQTATKPAPDVQFRPNPEGSWTTAGDGNGAPTTPDPTYDAPQVLAVIDWSWLRFAPFSLSRLVVVAGAIGLLSQYGDRLPFWDQQHLEHAWQWLLGFALALVIVIGMLGGLTLWLLISISGYVIQWWNLQLTREHGTIRLTSGAFTTRSTTVEEARVRGVEMVEPVLLRLVRGGELSTLATGVSEGVTRVLPPCPVTVCESVGHALLDPAHQPETAGPLTDALVQHGPAARRRCHIRSQRVAAVALAVAIAATIWLDLPWWLPVLVGLAFAALGVAVAEAEYRHLGHRLDPDHLTAGSGALTRRRTVLERDGVIGWVVKQTWFQRRRDLATLVATTAAGHEHVEVRDLPLARAIELSCQVTPDAVRPFLTNDSVRAAHP